MKYIIALIIFMILVLYFYYDNKKNKERKNSIFLGRESISNKKFYEKYFKEQKIPELIVYGVKKVLEEQLDTDLSKLKAEDDFSTNLSVFFTLDSMADVEIVIAIEEKFNIEINDTEAEKAHTINNLINLVWSKVNNKPDKHINGT